MLFLVPDCQYEFHVGAFCQLGMSLVLTSITHKALLQCLVIRFDWEGPSQASRRTDTLLARLAPARSCSAGLCRCNAATSPSSPRHTRCIALHQVHVRCYGAHGCSRRYG